MSFDGNGLRDMNRGDEEGKDDMTLGQLIFDLVQPEKTFLEVKAEEFWTGSPKKEMTFFWRCS